MERSLLARLTRSDRGTAAPGRLPDFIIIGAMRSGTTSLFRRLTAHPEVEASTAKELHFFDKHFERGLDWYRAQFRSVPGTIGGEATPNYLFDPDAIARAGACVPEARLIAILRDPVDRAYSHYLFRQSIGMEHRSLAEAMGAAREAGATGLDDYLTRGVYVDQLAEVLRHFPRRQLLVLLFDDLSSDPVELYRRTCSFLGIDQAFVPERLDSPVNPYITFRSSLVRRALRQRGPRNLQRLVGRLNTRTSPWPVMDPDVRSDLRTWFRPHNARLATWLGRDLSDWDE